jgi:hypothetical protein
VEGSDWEQVWAEQSKTSKNQQTRFVASHGDYQAIITLDALVGHDDQYNSTLTIVNTARYGGLLSPPSA